MEKELNNWKKQIKELENKLKSNIQIEGKYFNGFLDIFSLIKSIINNQEEKLKDMKNTNKNNNTENYALPGSLSDFANLLRDTNNLMTRENKNCTIIADKSNINYNEVNSNIREIINQVIEEFNKQVLKVDETNIKNSNKQNNNNNENSNNNNNYINGYNNNNIYNQNIQSQNDINNNNRYLQQKMGLQNDSHDLNKDNFNLFQNEEDEFDLNDFESKINNGFNPSKLILNITEEISLEDLVESLRSNLGIENCFILPQYNYEKLLNTNFDLNSVDFDNKNVFHKIFPMIENDENKLAAKNLLEGLESPINNSISNINKMKKFNMDFEKATRYDLLTPLQKLIILYGIFTTGNNPYLVNCILNIYYPTHCVMYGIDEMAFICKKLLDEFGIEFESNFCNIKDDIFNLDKNNKFYLSNSQKVDLESSIFISEFSDFEYNNTIRKIYNIKDDNNKEEYNQIFHNIKNKDQYKLNCNFNINNKNMSLQRSKLFTNIITHNPYLKNNEIKKNFLKKLVAYLKELCDKINQFKKNNKSKFNYFTGEQVLESNRQINDLNYKEIIENKNRKLNKEDVIKQLREHKNEFKTFSIKKHKEELIKKEEKKGEELRIKILKVLNPYSEFNIKDEWERMRNVWYQNNQRFNPLFKISDTIRKNNIVPGQSVDYRRASGGGNSGNDKDIKDGGSMFAFVQEIKTNQ